jgi:predicted HTH domain antitoxin
LITACRLIFNPAASRSDPARAALEALAIEGYRAGELSESEVREMLGYETRMEVHALLRQHDVYLHYSPDDLEEDRESARLLAAQHPSALLQKAG